MTKPRVFISYSQGDAVWARSFAEALKQRGVSVWLDQLQIPTGEPLWTALESGLRESNVLVALIDPTRSLTPNAFFELGVAIGTGKRVVPIVPREADTSKIPFEFRSWRYLMKDSPEETAQELAQALAVA